MKVRDLHRVAEGRELCIGIGAGSQRDGYVGKVVSSARNTPDSIEVVVVGREDVGYPGFVESNSPEEKLIRMLCRGEVDAVVRGSLGAEKTLEAVKSVFGLERLFRVAVLETRYPMEKLFLLAPVGIDEGESVGEKVRFGVLAEPLMKKLGMDGSIAVLAGGRSEDIGRSRRVDRSLRQAEEVTGRLSSKGLDVENHRILIEDAIQEAGMIIPPDGVSGNLIFRTLTFLGGGTAIGAPIMNLDSVYIDTSRASDNYEDSIALAAALV